MHARETVTVERFFGHLKRKFPILGSFVRIYIERLTKLAVCYAVLHIVAKVLNDVYDSDSDVEVNVKVDDGIEYGDYQHEIPFIKEC